MHYFNDEVALSHDVTKSDLILRKKSWERLHEYICQLSPYYGDLVSWTLMLAWYIEIFQLFYYSSESQACGVHSKPLKVVQPLIFVYIYKVVCILVSSVYIITFFILFYFMSKLYSSYKIGVQSFKWVHRSIENLWYIVWFLLEVDFIFHSLIFFFYYFYFIYFNLNDLLII